ncbi:phosphoglycerate dehydrogenase-like enzyme [Hungatella effluvii]|uniref:Phosphoglycerate dehydrogenase-like enzyme n=1 Tax=Hungatella effluvii TaxID=1096246 RepID=A0A2V3YEY4_9FIRM|nr:hydroxyacid dehydrogenase [Hungatella effluvii]PXX56837.1 phosphoglycerate dehydrogenase-like enzyme [Hungatella effluvii]
MANKSEQIKILVSIPDGEVRDSFFSEELRERLERLGCVEWNANTEQYGEEELAEKLRGVDICISGWGNTPFHEKTLKYADKLKLIAHIGGSVRPMVGDAAFERGIRVCSGNRVFAESVAEGVLAYMLCSLRKIGEYEARMAAGEWPSLIGTRGLLGRSVGLVGYGMIAEYLVKFLKPFGCRIMVSSRHISAEELAEAGIEAAAAEEIFRTCDIVSLHSSLTARTKHSIGADLLNSMKDGALLVNTARGALIDEEALVSVLQERPVWAALDVFETEPLPMDSPLRECEKVLLMPHAAGPTADRRYVVTSHVLDDIGRFLNGEPLDCEIDFARAGTMTTVV